MAKTKTSRLKVGQRKKLTGEISIVFAGMPNEYSYSLVPSLPGGYSRYAYNLFFPITETHIDIEGTSLHILKVTPVEIKLIIID